MTPVIVWLEEVVGTIPLPLLEVWGRFSYVVGLALAICAFGGFTFRIGESWGFGRERQKWDAKAFLSLPPAGTRVRISIGGGNGHTRVAVHDQGRGVTPDVRETIFEKFATVEARQDSIYKSFGLGLAFCKLAIEAHGGTIGVDPRVPAGSTFWFELPA